MVGGLFQTDQGHLGATREIDMLKRQESTRKILVE